MSLLQQLNSVRHYAAAPFLVRTGIDFLRVVLKPLAFVKQVARVKDLGEQKLSEGAGKHTRRHDNVWK